MTFTFTLEPQYNLLDLVKITNLLFNVVTKQEFYDGIGMSKKVMVIVVKVELEIISSELCCLNIGVAENHQCQS